jgi:hypothetical protein
MARTRKITMTVFCLEEDAEHVKDSLYLPENEGWFFQNDCPLTRINITITEPTPEEDGAACDDLDEDSEPSLDIHYRCPRCGHEWDEVWPNACDSECPECGLGNITALQYKEQEK